MKLFLSGPMTGRPEFNRPTFRHMGALLIAVGFEVVNPADFGMGDDAPWTTYMRRAIAEMMLCDGVAALSGWRESRGAKFEWEIARKIDMPYRYVFQWLGTAHEHL